jgi:hypothetical protein
VPRHLRDGARGVELELVAPAPVLGCHPADAVDPRGAGAGADDRVHGVRRREAERGATGAAERLQHVLQHLVGAVAGPHLVGPDAVAEVAGQRLAQGGELAVRVPVEVAHLQRHRGGDRGGDGLGDVVAVLVRVEAHRDVELRRAVRRAAAQVVAQREAGQDWGHLPAPGGLGDFLHLAGGLAGHGSVGPQVVGKRAWTA